MFTKGFQKYVCAGDSIHTTVGVLEVYATLEYDGDTRPDEYDCYSAEDIERWRNDEWFYGGLVLSVYCDGVCLDDHATSLWGIDCNSGENNDYLLECANDMLEQAIKVGMQSLNNLMRRALEVAA